MRVALAQINPVVGHITVNKKKILNCIKKAKVQAAQLVIFPELSLSGYPPLDLSQNPLFLKKHQQALQSLQPLIPPGIKVLLGAMYVAKGEVTNSAILLQKKSKAKVFSKQDLADYDVFDEARYFKRGHKNKNVFSVKGLKVKVLICEELWQKPLLSQKPDLIFSLHASPFTLSKEGERLKIAKKWAVKNQCPLIYVNMVGGQEELIFDGGSFILDPKGEKVYQSDFFKEDLSVFDLSPLLRPSVLKRIKLRAKQSPNKTDKTIKALCFGLKDFLSKNGFQQVIIGLSGGLDSAVLAEIAFRALGPDNVHLFFLPGPWTSALSQTAAKLMAKRLNSPLMVESIKPAYHLLLQSPYLKGRGLGNLIMKQNLQARIRNVYLMAYANKWPKNLLLGSANKSELALGYGTLYGDLTGGLLPLGDLFKTEVEKLALTIGIPSVIRDRAPTAELAKNQKDTDDLPPYEKLDPVLKKLIEEEKPPTNAFEQKIFYRITKNQFKRRQTPPVLKLKNRSFDRGWRWPFLRSPFT